MKAISAGDATALARIAGNPVLAKKDEVEILSRMSSDESRQIAKALLGDEAAPAEAQEAATAIRQWAARQPGRSRRRRLAR